MPPLAYDPTRASLDHPGLTPTIFDAASVATLSAEAIAVECARLAYLRFEDDPGQHAQLVQALATIGAGAPAWFNVPSTGTQAYTAALADGTRLVAFRGTQPDVAIDIAMDVRVLPVPWDAGLVHAGFAAAYRSVAAALSQWLVDVDPSRLLFTGHSLGAALATLAASRHPGCRLVTIGCPRVGDAAFCALLATVRMSRFVDCCDAVTRVPLPLPHGYQAAGPALYIDRHGVRRDGLSDEALAQDQALARVDYIAEDAWKPGNVRLRDFADHTPMNYLRALVG